MPIDPSEPANGHAVGESDIRLLRIPVTTTCVVYAGEVAEARVRLPLVGAREHLAASLARPDFIAESRASAGVLIAPVLTVPDGRVSPEATPR
jgi:hypothetical protein